ncbi:MAG: hydroxymethylbilane synthase [Oscillospiraceae bacterium]|jgi:hydroxymethylbilane synthase|nr:hydroxymethylbilane synthase [Oscillospiraceae bacterium]
MTKKIIRIGSRKSRLARIQTKLVAEQLLKAHPELEVQMVTMDTTGDILRDRPLDDAGGKGLFTLQLEQALRSGKIDLSVHSLKDMPEKIPDDLPVLAYSKREDPRDVLILPKGTAFHGFQSISYKKPVGCSSTRRSIFLQKLCPGISITPVRGNVPTRIRKLDEGNFSAVILAAAGLKRLGLMKRASYIFSETEMLPAAGQGILAVQGRNDFDRKLLECVDDAGSRTAACAERAVIAALGCSCSSPAAAYCRVFKDGKIELRAFYVSPKTGKETFGTVSGVREESIPLAENLAAQLQKEAENIG